MDAEARPSLLVALISTFAALHAVLAAIPGVWRSLAVVAIPLEGVLLGPKAGFLAALIGAAGGRILRPRAGLDPVFGIAEPVGALVSGLAFKGKQLQVFTVYGALLLAYFLHPVGRRLPAWCLWDIYIAFAAIPLTGPTARRLRQSRGNPKALMPSVVLSSFIGVEADVLVRIFMFIPLGLYSLMGVPEEALPAIWVAGAFETPIESAISVLASTLLLVPLLKVLEDGRIIRWPLT